MADRCLLCAHPTGRLVLRKPDVALRRCDRCHFVQQDPVPEPVAYDARYEHAGGSYGVELMRDKHLFLRRDEQVVRALAAAGASGPLLDVGAGAGILLEAARNVGWHAIGLELARASVDDIRTRLGLDVHACAIEDAPLAAGTIGAVTFSHSLEHLLDPVRALRAAWRLLRPGGFVHVAVPHWRAAKRWVAGREIPWIFPEHISYFTKHSLRAALEQAGFIDVRVHTAPMVCDADFRFAIVVMERFGLDRLVRRFLRLGDRRLGVLLTDDVAITCPPWRFRAVVKTTRGLLWLWPERLLAKLGLAEELRATARRPHS